MTPADLMAIMQIFGRLRRRAAGFHDDRDRLLSILETMIVGEGQGFDEATTTPARPTPGAAFGQDDSEFKSSTRTASLSALQTAAKMLGQLNEKKSLIYFASGLRLNGVDNQAQLHATINAAIRAGVSFWPIDARGLVARRRWATRQGIAGRHRHVFRRRGAGRDEQLPAVAGHAVCAGGGYRRQGAARQQRSDQGIVQAQKSIYELLHHRLLHHQYSAGRQDSAASRSR